MAINDVSANIKTLSQARINMIGDQNGDGKIDKVDDLLFEGVTDLNKDGQVDMLDSFIMDYISKKDPQYRKLSKESEQSDRTARYIERTGQNTGEIRSNAIKRKITDVNGDGKIDATDLDMKQVNNKAQKVDRIAQMGLSSTTGNLSPNIITDLDHNGIINETDYKMFRGITDLNNDGNVDKTDELMFKGVTDLNNDGNVNKTDELIFKGVTDLNNDGVINSTDNLMFKGVTDLNNDNQINSDDTDIFRLTMDLNHDGKTDLTDNLMFKGVTDLNNDGQIDRTDDFMFQGVIDLDNSGALGKLDKELRKNLEKISSKNLKWGFTMPKQSTNFSTTQRQSTDF
jgi:hypothetical protein